MVNGSNESETCAFTCVLQFLMSIAILICYFVDKIVPDLQFYYILVYKFSRYLRKKK